MHDTEPSPDHSLSWLKPEDIEEFRQILKEETGIEVDQVTAWNRVHELIALYRVLLEGLKKEGVESQSHKMTPIASTSTVQRDDYSTSLGQLRLPLGLK